MYPWDHSLSISRPELQYASVGVKKKKKNFPSPLFLCACLSLMGGESRYELLFTLCSTIACYLSIGDNAVTECV